MKATHILWSLAIVVCFIVLLVFVIPGKDAAKGGIATFFLFLLTWAILLIASPLMILFARLRVIVAYHSFVYTLLFTLNSCYGCYVLLQVISGGIDKSLFLASVLGGVNLLWAVVLGFGVCVSKYGRRE